MACFIVPAAEAVVSTIITKVVQKREKKESAVFSEETVQNIYADNVLAGQTEASAVSFSETACEKSDAKGGKLHFSRKLKWLNKMLWGGTALLAFEHVWHGEVTPWFPFLTAADSPAGVGEMLKEMSTVGTAMAVLVTAVWIGMVAVTHTIEKRAQEAGNISGTEKERM